MSEEINIGKLVLLKNSQVIVVNKPPGLPVQPDKTEDTALLQLVESYCKHPVHLVHRIDRPASGVVLFAKNKKALTHLSEQFKSGVIEKKYWAVVKNAPEKPEGELIHFLLKNGSSNRSKAVSEKSKNAKEARLKYKTIASSELYRLLEIDLLTGRHHQIRAQLSAINCPIKGDVKYGFRRGNRDRSIHLHAKTLIFKHPVSGEKIQIDAPLPEGDSLWRFFKEEESKNK